MKCVVVIQARRQSTRLPDKVMLPLAGVPVLTHVIRRCLQIEGCGQVICALPEDDYNDPLEALALESGAQVHRGSLHDVLERYHGAVQNVETDYVMRVTSDCPLLDPAVCGELLRKIHDQSAEYGATAEWPHGLDCEVFTKRLLIETQEQASHPYDREHVTLWMKRAHKGRCVIHKPEKNYQQDYRWVVDYPEDYEFLKQLMAFLPKASAKSLGWQDILHIVDENPALAAVNRECISKWREATDQIYDTTNEL